MLKACCAFSRHGWAATIRSAAWCVSRRLKRRMRNAHIANASAWSKTGSGSRTASRLCSLPRASAKGLRCAPGTVTWLRCEPETRIGQKNKITRRWTKRGTRPSAPNDQRTASTYIFGAICPAEGKGAGLVLPRCTTQAMALHLAEIATMVAPGAHAILVLDKAGWHIAKALSVPPNITLGPAARQVPGAEPGRKQLAVHARQLAFEPRLHVLRRHRRPLLLRLEQAHRPTLEDHVDWHARLGLWVLVRETWYEWARSRPCGSRCKRCHLPQLTWSPRRGSKW